LLTHRQTNKLWQKHNLFGGGKNIHTIRGLYKITVYSQINTTTIIKKLKSTNDVIFS